LSVKKSDLIKDLANNYPNFLKKDLAKLIDIVIDNIKNSLKNGERVELRDTFMFEAKKYKSKYARNPKTNEKLLIPEKKIVRFKISKKWQKLINEKK
tara:strand:- start:1740 stop:2030 length:291 start_codon:yes stop_codon:yes gene_type:complete